MVEKNLVELHINSEDSEMNSYLEVAAYGLDKEEHRKIREELDKFGFSYKHIDKDSVVAILYDGTNKRLDEVILVEELIDVADKLESLGWSW